MIKNNRAAAAALLLCVCAPAAATQTARPPQTAKPPQTARPAPAARPAQDAKPKPAAQKEKPQPASGVPACRGAAPAEIVNGVYLQLTRRPADPKTAADLGAKLAGGELSVKELVRRLALSEEFKRVLVNGRPAEQSVALVHERLLARPPDAAEMAGLAQAARSNGFDSAVNSIVDGPEYARMFGEHAVPGRPVRLRVCGRPAKLSQDDDVGAGQHMTTSVSFTADGRVEGVTRLKSSGGPSAFCGRVALWLFDEQGGVIEVLGPSSEQALCMRGAEAAPDGLSAEWKAALPRGLFERARAAAIIHTRDDASPRDFTRENVARARATKQPLR